jgi:hypothetical protein
MTLLTAVLKVVEICENLGYFKPLGRFYYGLICNWVNSVLRQGGKEGVGVGG